MRKSGCRLLGCLLALFPTQFITGIAQGQGSGATLADPVRLKNEQLTRGDRLQIEVPGGPSKQSIAKVQLIRQSRAFPLRTDYTPAAAAAPGVVRADVPPQIPLGTYEVVVEIDGNKYPPNTPLTIGPPGFTPPHLKAFSPEATYDLETAYVPDPRDLHGESVPVSNYQVSPAPPNTANVTIVWRNTTFTPDSNDCPASPVLGSNGNPIAPPTRFSAVTKGNVLLFCSLPAEAKILVDGAEARATPAGPTTEMWILKPQKGIKVSTVRLTLHGSGFQMADPTDNQIWMNGARQATVWDTCSNLSVAGARDAPAPLKIHGEVISSEEIRLCSVPIPRNGEIRLAAGYGDTASETLIFHAYRMSTASVAALSALIAGVLALLPLLLLSFVQGNYRIAGSNYKLRMLFLDPATDTYSLSKFQFYLWTVVSLFAYAYLFVSRVHVQFANWPDIPATLPGIIAVAGGTAVTSQIITSSKGSKGSGEEAPSIADFITSGGVVAADRLQMFLWTLFGVGTFFYAVLQLQPGTITELPSVPERLLVLMGLSSAGYLGGKMARKAGPVIDELSLTPADSDQGLTAGIAPGSVNLPDVVGPIVTAQAGLGSSTSRNANTQAARDALAAAIKAASAAQTVSEWNGLVATLSTQRAAAESAAMAAASDFDAASATPQESEAALDAQAAQDAAAALQDFSAGITQAIAAASAGPMRLETNPSLAARTIEIRGSSLSPDAMFEIDHIDLPFRMLRNTDPPAAAQGNLHSPQAVLRDSADPSFARVLRLEIDPSQLGTTDVVQYQAWFALNGRHVFTLTNPDGQKAELSFDIPPGVAQKAGSSS